MKLLTSSAGHESLWYQRRLFSFVFLTWMSKKNSSRSYSDSSPEFSKFTDLTAVLVRLSELLSHCPLDSNNGDDQSDEYDVDSHISSHRCFFEKFQQDSLSSQQPHEQVGDLIPCMQHWLHLEIHFVLSLLSDEVSWNPKLQRKYGLRYLYFVIFVVIPSPPSLLSNLGF